MSSPRLQVRRQSTLPAYPGEYQQSRFPIPLVFNHSPEEDDAETSSIPIYPIPRQSSYSSYSGSQEQVYQRQLPTSPNMLSFNKSPENSENEQVSPRKFMRQSTLPNPDKHIKLLPTSPPSKSPQFKRSPEFKRQMTISNPEGMSTLSIPQFSPKFLPISPKQKQSFLFTNPSAPRTFLSQQNFPPISDEPQPTSPYNPNRDHAKMIKVRSHSNEEYSFNKANNPQAQQQPQQQQQQQHEGSRRLLPEIPTRARSPNRLVRQDRVSKEEYDKRFREDDEYNPDNSDDVECVNYSSYDTPRVDIQSFDDEVPQAGICSNNGGYYATLHENIQPSSAMPCEAGAVDDKNNRKFKADATARSVSEESPVTKHRILPRRSFSQPEKECLKKSDELQKHGSDDVDDVNKVKNSKEPKYNFHKVIEMKRYLESGEAKKLGNAADKFKDDNFDLLNERREVRVTFDLTSKLELKSITFHLLLYFLRF